MKEPGTINGELTSTEISLTSIPAKLHFSEKLHNIIRWLFFSNILSLFFSEEIVTTVSTRSVIISSTFTALSKLVMIGERSYAISSTAPSSHLIRHSTTLEQKMALY